MRKLFLLIGFFSITPFVFLFCIVLLATLHAPKQQVLAASTNIDKEPTQQVAYAALPTDENIFTQEITQKDARVEILHQFFSHYHSPLQDYAQTMVDDADKYNLDFRLLAAIGMTESNLCLKAPKNSFNCWGFGIWPGHVTRFSGYEEAIHTITKTLAVKYRDGQGLVTPKQIMSLYNPSSPNGAWAHNVDYFMSTLQ